MIVRPASYGSGLIQTIRAHQAIMEAGVTISITEKRLNVYQYLDKFFKLNYALDWGPLVDVEINHQAPFVRIGNESRPLLYPHYIFDEARKFWGKRYDKPLFIGFIPDYRKKALLRWRSRANIVETDAGRKSIARFWDTVYYTVMGKSKFVLCPDGGWPWSYRFFEAILCGATPIVQTEVPSYEGFYYHRWNDVILEHTNIEHNLNLAKERLTMPPEIIRENLIQI
jgi:hypothetical protein